MDIEKFLLSHEELSKKMEVSLPSITDSLGKSEFKNVGKSLLVFISKSGYLMSSIVSSCLEKNVYSASVLFRSMIEHSFRHLYIFARALNDNNDSVGEEYYHSLKANEDLESIEKIINYRKVVYPEEAKCITRGDHNNSIREIAKHFRIEQIFYYLVQNNKDNDEIKKYKKEYLLNRLIEYTNTSSSVHGGPFSESVLLELRKDEAKLNSALEKFINDSFLLHKSIIETTYLFASLMDDVVKTHYDEIMRVEK